MKRWWTAFFYRARGIGCVRCDWRTQSSRVLLGEEYWRIGVMVLKVLGWWWGKTKHVAVEERFDCWSRRSNLKSSVIWLRSTLQFNTYDANIKLDCAGKPNWKTIPCYIIRSCESVSIIYTNNPSNYYNAADTEQCAKDDLLSTGKLQLEHGWHRQNDSNQVCCSIDQATRQEVHPFVDTVLFIKW